MKPGSLTGAGGIPQNPWFMVYHGLMQTRTADPTVRRAAEASRP